MHQSRLCQVIIDCQASDLSEAAKFWSGALGLAVGPSEQPASEKYVMLGSGKEDFRVLLQKVDHPSRVHLDIETDDVDREAARLEKLGAKRVEKIQTWWIMEAPSGHRFCVVRQQHERFPADVNRWP
jgi:predicted enzyme related to lactoylglutathione lyase